MQDGDRPRRRATACRDRRSRCRRWRRGRTLGDRGAARAGGRLRGGSRRTARTPCRARRRERLDRVGNQAWVIGGLRGELTGSRFPSATACAEVDSPRRSGVHPVRNWVPRSPDADVRRFGSARQVTAFIARRDGAASPPRNLWLGKPVEHRLQRLAADRQTDLRELGGGLDRRADELGAGRRRRARRRARRARRSRRREPCAAARRAGGALGAAARLRRARAARRAASRRGFAAAPRRGLRGARASPRRGLRGRRRAAPSAARPIAALGAAAHGPRAR